MPADRLARARVIQWMCFEQSNVDKVLGRTRFLRRYPDFMATTKADWDGWYATGYRALDVMDAALRDATSSWATDTRPPTSASTAMCIAREEGGFDLRRYTNVTRWLNRGTQSAATMSPSTTSARRSHRFATLHSE